MIVWKRDKKTGHHGGFFEGRKVARVVRLSASAWRWSYRAPREGCPTLGEARILKHAKQAVGDLHATKHPTESSKPDSAVRVEGPPCGVPLEVESTPQKVCDFQEGETPSTVGREPGGERVERPNPAALRGMVSGETPGQTLSSREKHPATLHFSDALSDALFGNEGAR